MKTKMNRNTMPQVLWILLVLPVLLLACNKADLFKEKLDGIPQVDYSSQHRYRSTYTLGDTLRITGILHPDKGLKIYVGGVQAPIVETASVTSGNTAYPLLDQVSVIIKREMGTGSNRPVEFQLGTDKVGASPIAIYDSIGEGSLTQAIKIVSYTNAPIDKQSLYLNCVNGKGDVYYLCYSDHQLYHVKKDGSYETLLSESQLTGNGSWSFHYIQPFLAGGVNPQGTKAWLSVKTSANDYRFLEADLQTKIVKTLNRSSAIAAPYEGSIGSLQTVITGIYPDSIGKMYVKIGTQGPIVTSNTYDQSLAVGQYDSRSGQLSYLFTTVKASADMPGNPFNLPGYEYMGVFYRFSPKEGSLYIQHQYGIQQMAGGGNVTGLSLYDLSSLSWMNSFKTGGTESEYTGTFSATPTAFVDNFIAQLPLPGHRLLGFYNPAQNDGKLPQWIVMSFDESRNYRYAPGKCQMGSFYFGPGSKTSWVDEALNYDEEGQLYLTGNGRGKLLKTAKQ